MINLIKWKKSVLQSKLVYQGKTLKRYEVALIKGEWPPEADLRRLCDAWPCNFGGNEKPLFNGNKLVTVYID